MTPHARDRPQGPACKMGELGCIIGNAEIEIRLARHQQHLRPYGLERLREIAIVKSIIADITVKPGECLRIQVRRAALRKPLGPIDADEGFEIGRAKRAFVEAGTVEILAQAPAGINVPKALSASSGSLEKRPLPVCSGATSSVRNRPDRKTLL